MSDIKTQVGNFGDSDDEQLKRRLEGVPLPNYAQESAGQPHNDSAAHWKANHDNLVQRLSILLQRHDLPVDRIPAYRELVRLQESAAPAPVEQRPWEAVLAAGPGCPFPSKHCLCEECRPVVEVAPAQNSFASQLDHVTVGKIAYLTEKGMKPVGVVLMDSQGKRATIDMGRVTWGGEAAQACQHEWVKRSPDEPWLSCQRCGVDYENRVTPVQDDLIVQLRHWFATQRKAISKGCGSTWDMLQCDEQIDLIDAAIASSATFKESLIVADQPSVTLKQLGARLADLLDDDQFNNIEPLLIALIPKAPAKDGRATFEATYHENDLRKNADGSYTVWATQKDWMLWQRAQHTSIDQLEELGAEVARLQKALMFWLPVVPTEPGEMRERAAGDAFLLVGCDGPDDEPSAEALGWITLHTDAQAQPVVPEGWQLVPKEPAPEMLEAAWDKANELWHTPEGDDPLPGHQYRAMLAAAPTPGKAQP